MYNTFKNNKYYKIINNKTNFCYLKILKIKIYYTYTNMYIYIYKIIQYLTILLELNKITKQVRPSNNKGILFTIYDIKGKNKYIHVNIIVEIYQSIWFTLYSTYYIWNI